MAQRVSRKNKGENRITNAGRWPVRMTHFHLFHDYIFPATNFPEIFYVQQGRFIHQTPFSTQSVREGTCLVVHPGCTHDITRPEGVVLTRVRFLPEWFSQEYQIVTKTPRLLSLFFDQSWFHFPREEKLHVFATRGEAKQRVVRELDYLHDLLKNKASHAACIRIAVLKLMQLMADEHSRFWRGSVEVEPATDVVAALDAMEFAILRGNLSAHEAISASGKPPADFFRKFEELTGLTPEEYARRRRMLHAGWALLETTFPILQIAKTLGFSSARDFSEHFETIFQLPPEVYRAKYGPEGAETTSPGKKEPA